MDDRFLELLTRKLSGEINADELAELRALMNNNAAYKTQYKTFKMYWENKDAEYADNALAFQRVKTKIARLENLNEAETNGQQAPAKFVLFNFWRSVAAILLIGGYALFLLSKRSDLNNAGRAIVYLEKTTPRRVKSIITLSDGTKITLNSDSKLKYPTAFTGNTREVYLIGEAFFEVHKDRRHPFIIHTGKMNVRVLGTEFNVRSYPGEAITETSLIRGSIEVTLNDRPSDHIILKPKEKLIVKNNNAVKSTTSKTAAAITNQATQYTLTSITYANNTDTAVVETSWLKNKLVADNEEFGELAKKMQRWYGVDIHFANTGLEKLRYTVTFEEGDDLKNALTSLQHIENFHYKVIKSDVYIY